jgi:hypothetical protein
MTAATGSGRADRRPNLFLDGGHHVFDWAATRVDQDADHGDLDDDAVQVGALGFIASDDLV